MLWSDAFGCGPGYAVDHSSTEKWSAFRAPSLPAFPQDPDTREVGLKSRFMLPRLWHRVGKEASLGEVSRAVPLNS